MKHDIFNTELSPETESGLTVSVGVVVKQYDRASREEHVYREKYVIATASFVYAVLPDDQSKPVDEIFLKIKETNAYKEAIGIEVYEV
jgi:ketol-acid reductoisomerase